MAHPAPIKFKIATPALQGIFSEEINTNKYLINLT